ncbi:MAG: signal peptidase II [Clostridia bacterium]|nr:signal peptidase II [Clostridia bacterium]
MFRNSWLKVVWLGIISAACVGLDQLSKYLCVRYMTLGDSVTIIPKVLDFTYIQNKGAAFGSLSNARWVFMIASVVMIAAIAVYVIYNRRTLRYPSVITLSLILGGGIGNMIDRIWLGYVIDFIDVKCVPYWCWIFNVADSFVCVGAFFLVIIFIISEIKAKKTAEPRGEKENSDVTTDL